jgi:excisionase family DNA binding protein
MSSNIRIERICQFCGKDFIARTTVTQCCSDACAKRLYKARKKQEKVEASNEQTKAVREQPVAALNAKEFLSVTETCQLMGLSRWTVWRAIKSNRLPVIKVGRRTIIKRSHLDQLFEQPQPNISPATPTPEKLNIEDCYTLQALQKLNRLSQKALYELIKRNHIPKFKQGKFVYVPKAAIDQLLGPKGIQGSNNDTND